MDDQSIPSDPDEISGIHDMSTPTSAGEGGIFGITGLTGAASGPVTVITEEVPWLLQSTQHGEMDTSDDIRELDLLSARVNGYSYQANMSVTNEGYGYNFQSPVPVFSQELIDSLPECLRGLEPELLFALVQDENNILEILNDDGTVNEYKVMQLRHKLNIRPVTNNNVIGGSDSGYYGGSTVPVNLDDLSQQMGGGGYMSGVMGGGLSRLGNMYTSGMEDHYNNLNYGPSGSSGNSLQTSHSHMLLGGQYNNIDDHVSSSNMNMSGYQSNSQSSSSSLGGGGRMSRWSAPSSTTAIDNSNNNTINTNSTFYSTLEQNLGIAGSMMSVGGRGPSNSSSSRVQASFNQNQNTNKRDFDSASDVAKRTKKFITNKGTVACKFYGTPVGCSFGDKCSFSHVMAAGAGGQMSGGGSDDMNTAGGRTRIGGGSGGRTGQQQQTGRRSRFGPGGGLQDNNNNMDSAVNTNTATADSSIGRGGGGDPFGRDIR